MIYNEENDLKVIVEGFAAILAVLEHVADLSWVVLVHRLKFWMRILSEGN